MHLTERCALRKWHFLRKAYFYRQLPFSLFLHGNCSVYLLFGEFKHMPSYSQPFSHSSISLSLFLSFSLSAFFCLFAMPFQTTSGNSRLFQLTEKDACWWRKKKEDNISVVLKRQLWHKMDTLRWGLWMGPQGSYEVSFPGKGIYIFLQRPSDRDTISCPAWHGLTWACSGLKCNLVLRRGSSQEYCRNLGLRFSNPPFLNPLPFCL